MAFNLNGLIQDYRFISQQDAARRAAQNRLSAANALVDQGTPSTFSLGQALNNALGGVQDTAPKLNSFWSHARDEIRNAPIGQGKSDSDGGFFGRLRNTASDIGSAVTDQYNRLPEVARNIAEGVSNTGKALDKTNPVSNLIRLGQDIYGGDEPLPASLHNAIAPQAGLNHLLNGRQIAEDYGAGQQFNRLPGWAQTVADVAPAAAVTVGTGGASEVGAVPTALNFGKQLVAQSLINEGLNRGSEAAQDTPFGNLNPDVQQALIGAGTLGGGMLFSKLRPPSAAEVRAAKMGAKAGLTLPVGQTTTYMSPGESLFHGSPHPIEGSLERTNSGDTIGDFGPGPYLTQSPGYADTYTMPREESGEYIDHNAETVPGSNISHWTPTERLGLLDWTQTVTQSELGRVNDVLESHGLEPIDPYESHIAHTGGAVFNKLKLMTPEGSPPGPFAANILKEAGFDGMNMIGSEQTVWDPEQLQPYNRYAAATGDLHHGPVNSRVMKAYSPGASEEPAPLTSTLTDGMKSLIDNYVTAKGAPGWLNNPTHGQDVQDYIKSKFNLDDSGNPLPQPPKQLPLPEDMPTIAGGAPRRFLDKIPTNLTDINNSLRSLNTLFDVAFLGRLGPTNAIDHPKLYTTSLAKAFGSILDKDMVKNVWSEVDNKAAASGGLLPDHLEATLSPKTAKLAGRPVKGYGLKYGDNATGPIGNIPGIGRAAKVYQAFQDIYKPQLLHIEIENMLNSGKITAADLANPAVRADIGRGINLLTGRSSLRIGSNGSLAVEFPNWLASQGELIGRAVSDRSISGQMARRLLLKLVAVGLAVNAAANLVQEPFGTAEDIKSGDVKGLANTALWRQNRNGLPMTKFPGTDITWDVFGPLGEVVSRIAGIGVGGYNNGPEGAISKGFDTYRGVASPIAKIGIDQLTKSDMLGQRVDKPEERIMNILNTAAPFTGTAVSGVYSGERSLPAALASSAGLRVHQPGPIQQGLSNAGISPDDPDYIIKRKDYLQQHPELRTTNDVSDAQKRIAAERQQLSANLTAPDSTMSLVQFRDTRTKILQDQRDTLRALLGDSKGNALGDSQQAKWINSYNALFDQAKDPTDPSGFGVDRQKLDKLIAEWTNTNGSAALDFVNRYTGTGLSKAESAYINDLRKLDAAGYFKLQDQRYTHLQSGLTADEIDAIKQHVESVRLESPKLGRAPEAAVLQQLYPNLSKAETHDILLAGNKALANPELAKFKEAHRQELMWFDPKATWTTYSNATSAPQRQSHSIPQPTR